MIQKTLSNQNLPFLRGRQYKCAYIDSTAVFLCTILSIPSFVSRLVVNLLTTYCMYIIISINFIIFFIRRVS